jgi:hypothetical protein
MNAEETEWLLRVGVALTSLDILLRKRPQRSR